MAFFLNQKKTGRIIVRAGSLFFTCTLGLLLSGGAIPSAFAQEYDNRDIISLQNQVAQLKEEVNQLQDQSASSDHDSGRRYKREQDDDDQSGSNGNAGLLPNLLNRINALEDQQRSMRGELDDLNNQVQSKIDLLNKKIDDMNFAAGRGVNGANTTVNQPESTPSPTDEAVNTSKKSVAPAGVSAGTSLKDGQQALLGGDFAQSAAIARKILATPEGKKLVAARFLLAQSLAGQGNYKDSALNYYSVYKNFPTSPKAPEALLGVGYSLIKNGEKKAACQALGLLRKKYPNTSERIKISATSLKKKANCS